MVALWRRWFQRRQAAPYTRRPPLILINGLAEQAESWFANAPAWRRHFDVHLPNLIAYEGAALHDRIGRGLPISVPYLVEQLRIYLDDYVQTPPYHLVANSMGGKVAVEFAVRHPDKVARLVLLCPSGLAREENLPLIEGVRRSNMQTVVESVFYDRRCVPGTLAQYYTRQVTNRRWRIGLLRTVRGTMGHRVRELLPRVVQPTLLVIGREDRIVDPRQTIEAATKLPCGKVVMLPFCGHAPQIETAALINRLVLDFLTEESLPRESSCLYLSSNA